MATFTKLIEMNIFLKLKHWQVFGILMAIPMISQLAVMVAMTTHADVLYSLFAGFFRVEAWVILFSAVPTKWVIGYLVAMAVATVIIAAWLYSLGVNLSKKLPPQVVLHTATFRVLLFLALVCHLAVLAYGYCFVEQISAGATLQWKQFFPVVPLCTISSVGLCYAFCFVAKALKTAELKQTVTFSEYAPELLGLLLFPIGLWMLQPEINKLEQSPEI
jgi:hypothetical protein